MTSAMTQQTEATLAHHLQAFGEGNVDEIMNDYTNESTLFTPDGPLHGTEAIRNLFSGLFQDVFSPISTKLELSRQTVEEDIAYIAWTGESAGYQFHLGTDTFVVKDGKIASQTFAAHIVPKS